MLLMFFGTTDMCLDIHHLSCEKNWTHMPSTNGPHGKMTGLQVDEIIMGGFQNF